MNNNAGFNEMFKKIEISTRNKVRMRPDELRLAKTKNDGPFSRFVFSQELTDALPWIANDRVDLYQASKNLFALVPAKAGLLTLKSNGRTFRINNTNLCITLKALTQATSFSGWVDDDKLFFKANK